MSGASRRQAVAGAIAAAWGSRASAGTPPEPPEPLDGERLFVDVARYAAAGPKRTAGAGDTAVAQWLGAAAREVGAQVALRPFAVRQFQLERTLLIVRGRQIEALPFWYPKATSGLIEAPLTEDVAAAAGRCWLVRLPPGREGLRRMPVLVQQAAAAQARALILVVQTPSGEAYGHTQASDCAVPTLIVGDRDAAVLQSAAQAADPARLEIAGRLDAHAQAFNVVARIQRPGPLHVVTTPISAWTVSGGERGPGVALWLGLLRRAAASGRGSWLFAAFSGHELDGAGSRAFLAGADAPRAAQVAGWCHLGASIANRAFRREGERSLPLDELAFGERLLTNQAAWIAPLDHAFGPAWPRPQLSSAETAVGELKLYFAAGYPVFGFEGGGWFFHAPSDGALSTSPQLLGQAGAGLDGILGALGA